MTDATSTSALTIEPLAKKHERGAFSCGNVKIDNFFRNNARKDHDAYKVRVFVATEAQSNIALGFYSLTLTALVPDSVSEEARDKFHRVQAVPAIYLAMIGVMSDRQLKGIGYRMMQDVFNRALQISENAGCYAIALDALDSDTAVKYQRYGFEPFVEGELKMFITLSTLRAARHAAIAEDEGMRQR